LLGYRTYALPLDLATPLFEWWRARGFTPKVLIRDEKKGELRFSCTLWAARHLLADPPARLAEMREVDAGGVPLLFKGFLHRPGLFAGVLLAILLIVAAHLFVWDVRIEVEGALDAGELREELSAAGLRVGSFIPRVDKDGVVSALRRGDGRVAYATVNFSGTVACVQVREGKAVSDTKKGPANLVASRDGTVTMPLIFSGQCLVKAGDVVRAGQILAGGVIDTDNNGIRITRAAGQVLARTTHTYRVHVPLVYEEKVYTGENAYELALLFFNAKIKVFKNIGKMDGNCDIIEKTAWWSIGGARLPLGITGYQLAAYELHTFTRTAREARAIAQRELDEMLAADSVGRTMLSRTVETVVSEEGITLVCTVVCEEDIALTAEITS
jgi:similar to stage IV sporulation protein